MPRQVEQFAVFLCSYNGERFIAEQICSIATQTVGEIRLLISDDGSSDTTLALIEQAKLDYPHLNIQLKKGPQRGFQYNFMSFFDGTEPPAHYLAFADQDDIWEPTKLERAKNALDQFPIDQPTLYGSRTRLVDKHGKEIGFSPLFKKKPGFANALVQNISGGQTMMMNAAAWRVMNTLPSSFIVSHDWWAYQLVSAVGGNIIYDPVPCVRYRQHEGNLVGANNTIKARFLRIKMLLQNRFKHWNDINIAALWPYIKNFTPENQKILTDFIDARQSSLPKRLHALKKSGVYRQTLLGMMGLWVAALLGKC